MVCISICLKFDDKLTNLNVRCFFAFDGAKKSWLNLNDHFALHFFHLVSHLTDFISLLEIIDGLNNQFDSTTLHSERQLGPLTMDTRQLETEKKKLLPAYFLT